MAKKKKYKIRPLRFFVSTLIIVLATGVVFYGIIALLKACSADKTPESEVVTEPKDTTETPTPAPPEQKKNEGIGMLVSAEYPLPDDYKASRIVPLTGHVDVRDDDVAAAEEIVAPLGELMKAAKGAGATGLYVTSGYRPYEQQKKIYDEADDKSYVQPPNCSEHQTGLAVDMGKNGVEMKELGVDKAGRWLYENSWRYGFIVRYPQDKVALTGISYEPWHLRYVGNDIAKICYEQNLCLEEYASRYA